VRSGDGSLTVEEIHHFLRHGKRKAAPTIGRVRSLPTLRSQPMSSLSLVSPVRKRVQSTQSPAASPVSRMQEARSLPMIRPGRPPAHSPTRATQPRFRGDRGEAGLGIVRQATRQYQK